jgi:hypothetical protein
VAGELDVDNANVTKKQTGRCFNGGDLFQWFWRPRYPSPTLTFSRATLKLTTSSFLGHLIMGSTTPSLALFRRRPWYEFGLQTLLG